MSSCITVRPPTPESKIPMASRSTSIERVLYLFLIYHLAGRETQDRGREHVSTLSRRRRERDPGAEPRLIELPESALALATTELVDLGGDGDDADAPRRREIGERPLVVLRRAAYVEQHDEPAKSLALSEIALDGSREAVAIRMAGARKAVSGQVHEGEAVVPFGEEVDPPRASRGLAHPRQVAAAGDAVQER